MLKCRMPIISRTFELHLHLIDNNIEPYYKPANPHTLGSLNLHGFAFGFKVILHPQTEASVTLPQILLDNYCVTSYKRRQYLSGYHYKFLYPNLESAILNITPLNTDAEALHESRLLHVEILADELETPECFKYIYEEAKTITLFDRNKMIDLETPYAIIRQHSFFTHEEGQLDHFNHGVERLKNSLLILEPNLYSRTTLFRQSFKEIPELTDIKMEDADELTMMWVIQSQIDEHKKLPFLELNSDSFN